MIFHPYLILVPGGLGEEKQGFILNILSLSFSAGRWATSYSTKTYAILHAVEWCISHSLSGALESVTLLSDSQSVLTTLDLFYTKSFNALFNTKSLTDNQSLFNILSDSKVLHFQWIPGRSFLPSNGLADSLLKSVPLITPSQYYSSSHLLFPPQRLSFCTS